MKKTVSLLLALAMIVPSLAGCSESKTNTDDETASAQNTEAVSPAETEPPETELPLPEADYDGYEVRVLNNISNFAYTNIGEEGLTGESLDDAA